MSEASESPTVTSPFTVHVQYLKDLSFENPNPLAHIADTNEEKPDINVNVQVNARHITEKMFEVVLEVSASAKRGKEVMFICQVQYATLVTLQLNDIDNEQDSVREILLELVPHLMFPFARNIVADVTRDSGFPPLMLQPVDFAALSKAQKNKKSMAKEGSGSENVH